MPPRLPNTRLTPRLGRTRYQWAQELPTCHSISGSHLHGATVPDIQPDASFARQICGWHNSPAPPMVCGFSSAQISAIHTEKAVRRV